MNKLISIALMSSSLFIFSGCGGGSDAPVYDNPPVVVPPDNVLPDRPVNPDVDVDVIDSIDIMDLDNGYSLEGYSDNGELVILEYCHGTYNYYRDSDYFYGDFDTNNLTINMYDSDGGSYVIDTDDGVIDIGVNYYIFDINSDITVDTIAPLDDCY